ncbi:MAG: exodeoxyribonuclease VII small subunit [Chloroflexi bacterium]|nr:exodeoxyribonuclease VII small subunit [Chloroflexota bacterium]
MSPTRSGVSKGGSRAATFESSFTRLEEVVRKLEEGRLTLDEASGLFEEGMRLAKTCNELLSSAELKITRLKSNFAEQMNLVPGEPDLDGPEDDEADD